MNGSPDPGPGSAAPPIQREEPAPDLTRITSRLRGPLGVVAVASAGLFLLAGFYTLYAGRDFFLLVVVAVLLKFLLTPAVRALKRIGLPAPAGGALILCAFVAAVGYGAYRLTSPAADWVNRAPRTLQQAEQRLRELKEPVVAIRKAGDEMEKLASVDGDTAVSESTPAGSGSSFSDSLLSHTRQLVVAGTLILFLLYFLLAADDLFLRKLVSVLPDFGQRRKAVLIIRSIETDLTRYIFVRTLLNVLFGAAVGTALWIIGLPNPILWGVMAGLLNYVPYLGGLVGYVIVGIVALVTFDSLGHALLAPAVYLGLNAIDGNVLQPLVLGRHLQLNPVTVFLWLIFWTWIWGIPGALLAVPLLAGTKIIADNVSALSPLGVFLAR